MILPSAVKYLIIGAGPTGLGAAYRLNELRQSDFLVLEAADKVGGLSRSFVDPQGFTWDIGGHVQFSHYPYFDELMLKALPAADWNHHERESWVWICDRFVPYPFQNNIHRLPPERLWPCLKELISTIETVGKDRFPLNFKEWAESKFGVQLCELFFHPYNFKVWATDPTQMSFQWIGERVSVVDIKRILRNLVFQKDDVSWGPNHRFAFPKSGGTGAIWEKVADLAGRHRIALGARVQSIDLKRKRARLENGSSIEYQELLSTMPLDLLTKLAENTPVPLQEAAKRLRFTTTHIVGLGIEGPLPSHLNKKCWMYFPENDCPFYRTTVFSNYASANVPDPLKHYSLMFEIAESDQKPVDAKSIIADVIAGAKKTKLLLPNAQIVSQWGLKVSHGYPVPTLERDQALAEIIPYFDRNHVYSRGRFGGWKYEVANQDHSAMQGVEWANRMVKDEHETTYTVPSLLPLSKAG